MHRKFASTGSRSLCGLLVSPRAFIFLCGIFLRAREMRFIFPALLAIAALAAVFASLFHGALAAPDVFLSTRLPRAQSAGAVPLAGLVVPAPEQPLKAVVYARDARRRFFSFARSAALSSDGAFSFPDITAGGRNEGGVISAVSIHVVPTSAPVVQPKDDDEEPSVEETRAIIRQVFTAGHEPVIPQPPAVDTEEPHLFTYNKRELQAAQAAVTMTLTSVPPAGSNAPVSGTLTSSSSQVLQVGVFAVSNVGGVDQYWGPKAVTTVQAGGTTAFTIQNWSNGAGDTTVSRLAIYAAPASVTLPIVLGAFSLPPSVTSNLLFQAISDRRGGVVTVTPAPVSAPAAPVAPTQPGAGGSTPTGGLLTFSSLAAPPVGSTVAIAGTLAGVTGSYTLAVFVQSSDQGGIWGPKGAAIFASPGPFTLTGWAASGSNDGTAPILIVAAFPGANAAIPTVLGNPSMPGAVVSAAAALYSCDRRTSICVVGLPGAGAVAVPSASPSSAAAVPSPAGVAPSPAGVAPSQAPSISPSPTPAPVSPSPAPVSSTACIVFTSVPPPGSTTEVTGRVNGLVPLGHRVVLYINLQPAGALFGPKPNPCNSATLNGDGTFTLRQWSQGSGDTSSSFFFFVLLPPDAPCPSMTGQTALPTDTQRAALVTVLWDRRANSAASTWTNPSPTPPSSLILGSPQQLPWPRDYTGGPRTGAVNGFIQFSGYRWIVKQTGAGLTAAPGDNAWSNRIENLWVDSNGLHLTYSPADGNSCNLNAYTASEVWLDRALGAGSYIVNFVGPVDSLPVDMIFSPLFFWADPPVGTGQNGYGEIDIEINRWGQPLDPGGQQYVIRPLQAGVLPPSHLVRVRCDTLPSYSGSGGAGSGPCYYQGSLDFGGIGVQKGTCLTKWRTGSLSWWCFAGHFSLAQIPSVPDALLYASYTYPEAYSSWVPDPNLDDRPHINLWAMYGRRPPTMAAGGSPRRIHAVITNFEFTQNDVSTAHLTRDKGITSRSDSQTETIATTILGQTPLPILVPEPSPAAAAAAQRLLLEEPTQGRGLQDPLQDLPPWAIEAAERSGYYDPQGKYHDATEVKTRLRGGGGSSAVSGQSVDTTTTVRGVDNASTTALPETIPTMTPPPVSTVDGGAGGSGGDSSSKNIVFIVMLGAVIIGALWAVAAAIVKKKKTGRVEARGRATTGWGPGTSAEAAAARSANSGTQGPSQDDLVSGATAFRPIGLAAPPAHPFPPSVLAGSQAAQGDAGLATAQQASIGSNSASFFVRRPRASLANTSTGGARGSAVSRAAELASLDPFLVSSSAPSSSHAQRGASRTRASPPHNDPADDDEPVPYRGPFLKATKSASAVKSAAPSRHAPAASSSSVGSDPGGLLRQQSMKAKMPPQRQQGQQGRSKVAQRQETEESQSLLSDVSGPHGAWPDAAAPRHDGRGSDSKHERGEEEDEDEAKEDEEQGAPASSYAILSDDDDDHEGEGDASKSSAAASFTGIGMRRRSR